ncbi:Pyridoxine 5'-phosphate synthase [Sulfidibacter corallicola]|uniref:Pyridoxine 5'-phosphate synthase n=1 Tax=Sulfidibacter corallicola TaxID=2818388 RepID=A0A8A4TG37_SULCO|nr:pyridoxine 5'-phosphate synthase [Sulfidibacter corallicola]QTD48520.1 pyridoxine 5'-phosphate synthase [Sulfidibacter corallicola]
MNAGPCKLIVSVDQVALLRASRNGRDPDPIHFALQAEFAGAEGIRAHLRIDRRHIVEEDVELLNRLVKTQFYLQVSPHQDIIHLVNGVRPHNAILAPERREEKATETGLDVALLSRELNGILRNIDMNQTKVFLLVEPHLDQIKAAAKLKVHGLALNVRDLMVDPQSVVFQKKFETLRDGVRLCRKYGMEAHLINGIQAPWIPYLLRVQGVSGIHVGHPLVAHALQVGVGPAVAWFRDHLARQAPEA